MSAKDSVSNCLMHKTANSLGYCGFTVAGRNEAHQLRTIVVNQVLHCHLGRCLFLEKGLCLQHVSAMDGRGCHDRCESGAYVDGNMAVWCAVAQRVVHDSIPYFDFR